jgi:alcohol dehydrogenase
VKLDFIPASTRAAGLGTLMKGAGKLTALHPHSATDPAGRPRLHPAPGRTDRRLRAREDCSIVTDGMIAKLGPAQGPHRPRWTAADAEYVVFDQITPDAPIPLIERGIAFYREQGCDALIAVGGGSSMDAAKAIAMAAANPKPLRRLAGYLKGRHHPAMPLYAVPTTAGTGSEVTVAAVISDPERHDKIVIVDTAAGAPHGRTGPRT